MRLAWSRRSKVNRLLRAAKGRVESISGAIFKFHESGDWLDGDAAVEEIDSAITALTQLRHKVQENVRHVVAAEETAEVS